MQLLNVLAIALYVNVALAFRLKSDVSTVTKLRPTTSGRALTNPKSDGDIARSFVRTNVLRIASMAGLLAFSASKSRADNAPRVRNVYGEDEPIVQGVIDLSESSLILKDNSHVLIEVYDAANRERGILAGAKLAVRGPGFDNTQKPFRFQLYLENLLVKPEVWRELGDFDQKIVVSLCDGDIKRGGWCRDKSISKGDGISRVVNLGSSEDRKIRLFPMIKVAPSKP